MAMRIDLPAVSLTAEGREAMQLRLRQLLVRQAERYTGGESTSLRVETAQALAASIRFSLETYLERMGLPPTALLTGEPDALLDAAETAVRRLVSRTRLVYDRACR